ncbi:MAG: hypothetical protein ACFFA8_15640, partial [Promethearchaeota archaeon]
MRRNYRFFSLIALYFIFILIYIILFFLKIDSLPFYVIFNISSMAVLSTGTIYTIIQSRSIPDKRIIKPKYISKQKSLKKQSNEFIEDYFDAMPLIDKYANSNELFEDVDTMDDYIFSVFTPEELDKINLLDLSKMDKIFFLRELLYFSPQERNQLIE